MHIWEEIMKSTPPNFVCIVADQLRFDMLGCSGHPVVKTPNIDKLAKRGIRFNRCYTVQPMCMATRSTWLTGWTPRGHGVRCNGIPLDTRIPTMPQALRKAGYKTHSIGKIHANPWMPHKDFDADHLHPAEWPEAISLWDNGKIKRLENYYGFESVDALCGWWSGNYGQWLQEREPGFRELVSPPGGVAVTPQGILEVPETSYPSRLPKELHYTQWSTECSNAFFDTAKKSGQPFFLWHSIPDPHPPFSVSEPYYSMYQNCDMPEPCRREGELDDLPPHYKKMFKTDVKTAGRMAATDVDAKVEKEAIRTVCGIITQWDDMVGRIMGQLEEKELMDNTVIVVMSDHGQMLGDHWMHNMPPSHLDSVVRVPSIWYCSGKFRPGDVSQALISHLDFVPTILDLAGVEPLEGRIPPHPEAPQQRPALPGKSFAGILNGETETTQDSVIIENDEDYLGMRQRSIITENWHMTCYIGEEYGELFDTKNDPGQLYNRWDDPDCQNTKRELQVQMLYRFAETDRTLPRRMGHA